MKKFIFVLILLLYGSIITLPADKSKKEEFELYKNSILSVLEHTGGVSASLNYFLTKSAFFSSPSCLEIITIHSEYFGRDTGLVQFLTPPSVFVPMHEQLLKSYQEIEQSMNSYKKACVTTDSKLKRKYTEEGNIHVKKAEEQILIFSHSFIAILKESE